MRLLFRALLLLPLCALSVRAAGLNVFAAASLSDALQEIAAQYERASDDKLHFNLAASSVLARQIKEGAPADIFFSADEAKLDDLVAAGLIASESRHSLLSNTLVIIVPAGSKITVSGPAGLADAGVARIALAEPQTVPAGIYAKAYLERAKLWEKIAGKVIPTENVRACLAAVESANVDAGIVYKTDALTSKKVQVAFEIPAPVAPRITYQFALLKASKQAAAATRFAAYLASSDAKAVFEQYGFTVLP